MVAGLVLVLYSSVLSTATATPPFSRPAEMEIDNFTDQTVRPSSNRIAYSESVEGEPETDLKGFPVNEDETPLLPPDIRSLKGQYDVLLDNADIFNQTGDYLSRTIVVHENESSYFDDLLYTAAVPAAVHWEGSSRYASLLTYDTKIRDTGILHGDWAAYLDQNGGAKHLDFIGPVSGPRQTEIAAYYGNPEDTEVVTEAISLYDASANLASYYWGSERLRNTDTAVIAYAPEPDGGIQVSKIHVNSSNSNEFYNVTTNGTETAWLRANVSWPDPGDDTVYDLSIKDPYSTHHSSYNTFSNWYKENPSNNLVFSHEGERIVGVSPLYSYLPFEDAKVYGNTSFSDSVGPNDGSGVPAAPFADVVTHTIGPLENGTLVECSLTWPGGSALELYIHPDGTEPDEYEFGWYYKPLKMRFVTNRPGYWDISVHTYTGNGDSYELNVSWGAPSNEEWHIHQFLDSDDTYNVEVRETLAIPDAVSESAANAAVLASLLDSPMLYSAGNTPEPSILDAIYGLGISKVIIVDPAGKMDDQKWSGTGLDVNYLSTDEEVFNAVSDMGYEKTQERDVVIPALGGPWFAAAALEGAAHAAPVPAPNDDLALSATNRSTLVWWDMIEQGVVFSGTSHNEDIPPKRSDMEQIADDFYSWLGGFSPAYDPSCNDADGNGVPDTGSSWDYSEDIDVVVVSPMNAIKMCFDRAINGKGSVGRIPEADPPITAAIAARAVLYWELAFSNGSNPEDVTAVPEDSGFWDGAGWTFVAYTHDDDIMDDDLGDDIDDDYCEVEDGGANQIAYKMSDELPQYATDYGVSANEFNTYYPNVMDMLESGVGFWTHADHGGYNQRFETGAGVLGLSSKNTNPWRDWDDGANVNDPDGAGDTMGLSNPSALDHISGNDLFYGLHDLPSTLIYLQDCQVGASHMPGMLLRLGSAGVVGDHYSMYIDPSPVYNDRIIKGLYSGMDYGQANRWALDESSAIYSMHDPAPPDAGGSAAYGYSVQCTLFGDPEIVIATPTLRPHLSWNMPVSGEGNITFNVYVTDQDGNAYPAAPNVSMNGKPLVDVSGDGGVGLFSFNWAIDDSGENILTVELSEPGYYDREHNETIRQDYLVELPSIQASIGNMIYTGNMSQTITIRAAAYLDAPYRQMMNNTTVGIARAEIYHADGIYSGIWGNLSYNGAEWIFNGNVSSLPSGEYYANVSFWSPFYSTVVLRSSSFELVHTIIITPSDLFYVGEREQSLDILNVTAISSRLGLLDNNNTVDASFHILTEENLSTNVSGNLVFGNNGWEARKISTSPLGSGQYTVEIIIFDGDTAGNSKGGQFFVEHLLFVSNFTVTVNEGNPSTMDIIGVYVTNTMGNGTAVNGVTAVTHKFEILSAHTLDLLSSGDLLFTGSAWEAAGVDISGIPSGSYMVRCTFATADEGPVSAESASFTVKHILLSRTLPHLVYRGGFIQEIDVEVNLGSGYNGTFEDSNITLSTFEFEILDTTGSATGIKGNLSRDNGSYVVKDVDVSSLREGTYSVKFLFSGSGAHAMTVSTNNFTVIHKIELSDPHIDYNKFEKTIKIENIALKSSKYGVSAEDVTFTYKINDFHGEGTGISGELFLLAGEYSSGEIDISRLVTGTYLIELSCEITDIANPYTVVVGPFDISYSLSIGDFTVSVKDGLLKGSSLNITSNRPIPEITEGDVTGSRYFIVYENGDPTNISGNLSWMDGKLSIPDVDISSLAPGDYKLVIEIISGGTTWVKQGDPFVVETVSTNKEDENDPGDETSWFKGTSRTLILIIVGALIAIICIVVFIVLYRRKDDRKMQHVDDDDDDDDDDEWWRDDEEDVEDGADADWADDKELEPPVGRKRRGGYGRDRRRRDYYSRKYSEPWEDDDDYDYGDEYVDYDQDWDDNDNEYDDDDYDNDYDDYDGDDDSDDVEFGGWDEDFDDDEEYDDSDEEYYDYDYY